MNTPSSDAGPSAGETKPADLFKPWLTYGLIAVTVLIYGAQNLVPASNGIDLLMLYGAKINEFIQAGQWWRVVTPVFLHVSILHILLNMWFLYVVGPTLERFYGRLRFALLFFLSAMAGNVTSFYLTEGMLIGASTALFGLIAANAVFVFRNRDFFGDRSGGMLRTTLIVIGINLGIGFIPGFHIDNWAAIGGLMGGLAFSWAAGPLLGVVWLPGGAYRVTDENSGRRFFGVAAAEAGVLLALVALRTFIR